MARKKKIITTIKIKPEIPKIRIPHMPTKVIPNKKKIYKRNKFKQETKKIIQEWS